jgi:undecaprenyl diphosphate synthase
MSAAATPRPVPRHIAIIMDGNGRWAEARGLPRIAGHRSGAEAARRAVTAAAELGVPYLTLFGFSSENWKRSSEEIQDLMGLLRHYLRAEVAELHRKGARLKVIGDLGRLAPDILRLIEHAEEVTRDNTRITVTMALSYGGRAEIVAAVRAIAEKAASGSLAAELVDEECLSRHLFTAELPDPDLLIRTSGEQRISNFLLWQCAYSELVFLKTLWPDFSKRDLELAIDEFCGRERRYGASVALC